MLISNEPNSDKKFKPKVHLGKVLINKYDLYNLKVFDFIEI